MTMLFLRMSNHQNLFLDGPDELVTDSYLFDQQGNQVTPRIIIPPEYENMTHEQARTIMILAASKSDKRTQIEVMERLAAKNGVSLPPGVPAKTAAPTASQGHGNVAIAGGETTLVMKRGRGRPRKYPVVVHADMKNGLHLDRDSDGDVSMSEN